MSCTKVFNLNTDVSYVRNHMFDIG
ncbi:uncharacterized protein METZ01_LOCUS254735 [marine metagenome]|uniref:Uncharacterized protein n=1 Tax=marine metagenome TaxID=408172 RepID=A0A382ITC2_9ZZZZ